MRTDTRAPTCPHCGSVLSAVTWSCVRGVHCPGYPLPRSLSRADIRRVTTRTEPQS